MFRWIYDVLTALHRELIVSPQMAWERYKGYSSFTLCAFNTALMLHLQVDGETLFEGKVEPQTSLQSRVKGKNVCWDVWTLEKINETDELGRLLLSEGTQITQKTDILVGVDETAPFTRIHPGYPYGLMDRVMRWFLGFIEVDETKLRKA